MAPRRHANGHGGALMENGGGINDAMENLLTQNQTTRCCTPTGECLRGDALIRLNALHDTVKVTCNNESCPVGQFMHRECFDAWEQTVLTYLKSCGRARSWSERQRHQNLWTKKGYDLAFKACGCRCGRGHLKKDLDWMPPGTGNASGNRPDENEAKKKKRRNRQNTRPTLSVSAGPPSHGNHVSTNGRGTTEAQLIESGRGRAGSLSSSTGSSSPPATSEPSVSPLHQPQAIMKKKSKVDFFSDRARQSCGANGIFSRRLDFSAFNSLPRTKLNSYHIKEQVQLSRQQKVRLSAFLKKPVLKTMGVAYGMMFAQQFSGINAVIFYAETIFKQTGVDMDSLLQMVIFAVVQVIACVVSASLIDKLGRRFLMILSMSVMCVCTIALGIFFIVKNKDPDKAGSLSWLPLTSACLYILAFSLGAGPIPWIYMGEIFPSKLKGTASSSAAFFNWILAFLVTVSYSTVAEAVGNAATFFFFAIICQLSVIFLIFCMVETKGKTFAEIQQEFGTFGIDDN
ncbi:hdc homolog, cell cycle regulator isoform X2 [Megachile rotundata]|uniref:hdc homolog, cell cycle regulator isoform X2 n=1 Tax=Megachile rotundata TaxID=143995 RepID=UPI000614C4E6|nr:PREDICTED: headcase protein-like isoform X2 [Megachile rotundata]